MHLSAFLATFLSSAFLVAAFAENPPSATVQPQEALRRLKEGNARFVSNAVSDAKPTTARRRETTAGQHPFAVIVGCADSRTSPEIIFDQNIGDVFVVRTAGNLVDEFALGSVEYAVEHLGARLIVVLGHESCGAVKAALAGGAAPGHIAALVHAIEPAVAQSKGQQGDPLANAIHANDSLVAAKIRAEGQFGDLASQIQIVEAYYNLHPGEVEWKP